MTFDEQVEEVLSWFKKAPKEEQLSFKSVAKDKLVGYHHTLGRSIRNRLRLWDNKWDHEIINGIDYSPNHPDAVSMRIIETVWERVQTL